MEIDQTDISEHLDPLMEKRGSYTYRGISPSMMRAELMPVVQEYRDDLAGVSSKKAVQTAAEEYLIQKEWELVDEGEKIVWLPKYRPSRM